MIIALSLLSGIVRADKRSDDGVETLIDLYRTVQRQYLPIIPPDERLILHERYSQPVPMAWSSLPPELKKGLVRRKRSKWPVYPVTIAEHPRRRSLYFFNLKREPVYLQEAPPLYEPYRWVFEKYPVLSAHTLPTEHALWLLRVYDPARIRVSFELIPLPWYRSYMEARESLVTEDRKRSTDIQPMAAREAGDPPPNRTNLWIGLTMNDGTRIAVHRPSGFTNNIDIFRCTDLVMGNWELAVGDLSDSETNVIRWTEVDDASFAVYAAGNADLDSDADTLADAREIFVYHTRPDTPDTDGDGMEDGWELINGFFPLDPGDAGVDMETDGLSNVQEFLFGTDPHDADTDGDGWSDGEEAAMGLDPLYNASRNQTVSRSYTYDQHDRWVGIDAEEFEISIVYDVADNMISMEVERRDDH